MKLEEFRGINPIFSVKGLDGEDHWYLLRLDWILFLAALVVVAILIS